MEEIHKSQVEDLQELISDLENSINQQTLSVGEQYQNFKKEKIDFESEIAKLIEIKVQHQQEIARLYKDFKSSKIFYMTIDQKR